MFRRLLLASTLLAAQPALANDSTAELGTGGLILSRSDVIAMEREDLFISKDKITVDYVFRNRSDNDVETIVAFPMPDIEANPYGMVSIPQFEEDNFLRFELTIDGRTVETKLEHKAFAVGIDVTAELEAHNVPLHPFGEAVMEALANLPADVADDWRGRGMLTVEEYDDGSGMKSVRSPYWQLKSTYWWKTMFPAGKEVHVGHRYTPSLGGSAGVSFVQDGRLQGDAYRDYKHKYCMDETFERAVLKAAKANPDGYPALSENRISYILQTGGNWALGTIGKFRLTIDKGSVKNLVSFCGTNVRKTGPTTFEMTAEDYYPDRNLDILILQPYDAGGGDSAPAPGKGSGG